MILVLACNPVVEKPTTGPTVHVSRKETHASFCWTITNASVILLSRSVIFPPIWGNLNDDILLPGPPPPHIAKYIFLMMEPASPYLPLFGTIQMHIELKVTKDGGK